jgi:2'-5' RNA ligase
VRAFLAIPVLAPALRDFLLLRERLVAEVDAVRWAPSESPHITLHFFGAISADDATRALTAVRPVIAGHGAMALRLRGLGTFPAARSARVLWCGVDGDVAALLALASGCAGAIRTAGFAVDGRVYHPHCTLGRPRQPWPVEALARWKEEVRNDPGTELFDADRVVLYESVREPSGIRHVARQTLTLR